jgi:MHS family proline/betaine transporter-like MFS transporter
MQKKLIAAMLGTIIEWYDFSIYAYFATVFAHLFFPHVDKVSGLIAAFAVFALGFFARPIGAIFFGHIGDKYGRRVSLISSMLLMSLSTVLMACLPTHATIGYWAAILLSVMRLLQGFSAGGETTGGFVYIIESVAVRKRGFYGALAWTMVPFGILLGSGAGAITMSLFNSAQIDAGGWRCPFFISFLLTIVILFLRRHMPETDVFQHEKQGSPILILFKRYKLTVFKLTMLSSVIATGFYLAFVYLPSHLIAFRHISAEKALVINTLTMPLLIITLPLAGLLSDKIGRRKILLTVLALLIVCSYSLFWLLNNASFAWIIITQLCFGLLIGSYQGPMASFLCEAIPAKIRYSATAFSFGLAQALFGGLTPLVATWIVERSGNASAPAFLLIACAFIAFCLLWHMPERVE